jgi:hypothetical protein
MQRYIPFRNAFQMLYLTSIQNVMLISSIPFEKLILTKMLPRAKYLSKEKGKILL